ncbi:hypothetical protein EN817_23415 [Mesorhizobium sp. M3A.F.Ca.ET.174.01.1.1]|uniref:hypothetical protein n=1 Tax=unclassified Mesorhizobium TaxID=325217 RepID=UPI00109409B7|nr:MULTISPECIES: hypothetical protein [unclassified Mesorhizobium]TGS85056.1 hypothetical protein EN818_21500 [Mesorhizobium sp. M3A.F.Ca.ET.175.01.1.1]TGT23044.1 hypothetical protein EN817_23415 [Mesorhizobium sp. M3A.F.Ca.ET.174.01.1.1]
MSLARRVGCAWRQSHRLLEPAPIGPPKIAEWRGTSVFAFAPTGRGVANFVQISFGREIKYLAGSLVYPDYVPTAPTICSTRPGCGVNL